MEGQPKKGFAAVLGNPNFRRLWAGQVVSAFGDWFSFLALIFYIKGLGGSGIDLSLLFAIRAIPTLFLGPLAGVIVDRFNRKRIMLFADAGRGALYILMMLVHSLVGVYAIYALTVILGLFFIPARNAVIPNLVRSEDLSAANSLYATSDKMMLFVGAVAAPIAIGFWGPQLAFLINALSFFLSAAAVLWTNMPPNEQLRSGKTKSSFGPEFKAGIRYVTHNFAALRLAIVYVLAEFGEGALDVLLPQYAAGTSEFGPHVLGMIVFTFGAGAAVAAFVLGTWGHKLDRVKINNTSLLTLGIALGAFGLLPRSALDWLIYFGGGLGVGAFISSFQTVVAEQTPDEVRGRMWATLSTLSQMAILVAMMTSGIIVDLWSMSGAFLVTGVGFLLAGVVAVFTGARLKRVTGETGADYVL